MMNVRQLCLGTTGENIASEMFAPFLGAGRRPKEIEQPYAYNFLATERGRWCPLIGTPSPIDKIKPFYFAARGTSCQAHTSLALGVMNNWGMLSSPAASFIYYTHVGGKQLGKNTCSSMFHAHIAYGTLIKVKAI